MNPQDFLPIIKQAVREGTTLSWWISAIVLLLSVIVSALSASLFAHFKKTGELLAINENFETALNQLKQNTQATTEIQEQIKLVFGKDLEHYKWELQVDLEFKKLVMPPRLLAIQRLWALTEDVSPTIQADLTPETRKKMSEQLRAWYYEDGNGIFLRPESTDLFLRAKATLVTLMPGKENVPDKTIRKAFSALRTQLKVDIGVYSSEEAKRQLGPEKSS